MAPGTPLKDRIPPPLYNADSKEQPSPRIAVLIDGSKVTPESFKRVAEAKLKTLGSPLIFRVFDVELKPNWQRVIVERGTKEGFEWFRVEKFVPVTLQMAADARHICNYREDNTIEAIAYVCTHVEGLLFEKYLSRVTGVTQFLFTDEEGLIDTRPAQPQTPPKS